VILARHTESTGDVNNLFGGWYDDNATKEGLELARHVAEAKLLALGSSINHVFTSPLKRAYQTALVYANILGVSPTVKEGLKECNRYGVMTGRPRAEGTQRYPAEVAALETDYRAILPEGEPYEVFKERVLKEFRLLETAYPKGDFMIVTHGGPLRCILREAVGLPELASLADCAFVEITARGNGSYIIGKSYGMVWTKQT
jgi:broad specificity phosphatase PhoE